MTRAKRVTRRIAERLGFLDPVRLYAAEVVRLERQLAKVAFRVKDLAQVVGSLDGQLLDRRAEVARLHYAARKAARNGADLRALRLLADKREAEARVRELEEEVTAGRKVLRQAERREAELFEDLDELRRAFQASRIVRLADDVHGQSRFRPVTARLERARADLFAAEALAELEASDPFEALPELVDDEDRLQLARWRAEDRARAA